MPIARRPLSLFLALAAAAAQADVSVQEQIDLNVAGIINAHGTSSQLTTTGMERSATEIGCEGLMSMLCPKVSSLDIVRLDRDVILKGDARKKSYTETPLPTPAERQALEERMKAAAEKLKSCPAPAHAPKQPGLDTSKCEMSAPVMTVTRGEDILNVAGHDARHTTFAMTQSCTNHDTGDVCDLAYTLDLWLANDEVPGLAERRTFLREYLHRMGLEDAATMAPQTLATQFLAPYAEQMKKLGGQSADLKGYPLKTSFRAAYGGAHCAAVAPAAAGSSTGSTGSVGDIASKVIGGLFGKKKSAESASKPADTGTADATSTLKTLAELTMTTTSISNAPIPADQFEMPADWKKVAPPEKTTPEMPNCPKSD
jgi:hypothetical protein